MPTPDRKAHAEIEAELEGQLGIDWREDQAERERLAEVSDAAADIDPLDAAAAWLYTSPGAEAEAEIEA
jgi:hypothetical protein